MPTTNTKGIPIDPQALPLTWATTTLNEIAIEVRSGKSSGNHSPKPPGIIHIRPMNISRQGDLDLSGLKYIQERYPDEFPRLRKGDIIFNNTNSADLVGKTTYIDTAANWLYSNHMTVLRIHPDLSSKFFARQLHHLWMRGSFRHILTQYINQATVSKEALTTQVLLAVPPAAEQLRIVTKLDILSTRMNKSTTFLQRARRNSKALIKAVIRASVTGVQLHLHTNLLHEHEVSSASEVIDQSPPTTRPPEIDNHVSPTLPFADLSFTNAERNESNLPLHLPRGWSWISVSEAGEIRLGKQRSPKSHTGPHIHPYLRVANVFEDRIDTSDVKTMNFPPNEFQAYQLEYGDILLNEGQSIEFVGRPAMFRGEVQNVCFQNTLIRFRARDAVDPDFALFVFRYFLHSGYFQRVARWSTNIAHLGLKRFGSLPFPLPPLPEQQRIVKETKRHLSSIAKYESLISSLLLKAQTLKRSIMSDAFAGRLVPQQSEEGIADDLLRQIRYDLASKKQSKSVPSVKLKPSSRRLAVRQKSTFPILHVLREAGGKLKTSELFLRCGFSDETIDDFYDALRHEVETNRVKEVRHNLTDDEVDLHPSLIEMVP